MKKLIEMQQDYEVVCDNPTCDFKVINEEGSPNKLDDYLDVACPMCGENLLTLKDYLQYLRLLKIVAWINKWFSWITIFYGKRTGVANVGVHVHNGVKIEQP